MKNLWSVICSRAIVDNNTNSLSILDCIEEIVVGLPSSQEVLKEKKNIPLSMTIVGLWIRDDFSVDEKFEQLIEIYDPNKDKLQTFSVEPVFEKGKKRLRTLMQINGMEIAGEGKYTIVVKYREKGGKYMTASELPFDIKFEVNVLK